MVRLKRPIVRVPAETRLVVVPYDPQWPAMYEQERAEIAACIGQRILRIEHAGSTSIPGMAGKPTVDFLVGVRDWDEARVTFAAVGRISDGSSAASVACRAGISFAGSIGTDGARTNCTCWK